MLQASWILRSIDRSVFQGTTLKPIGIAILLISRVIEYTYGAAGVSDAAVEGSPRLVVAANSAASTRLSFLYSAIWAESVAELSVEALEGRQERRPELERVRLCLEGSQQHGSRQEQVFLGLLAL